MTAAAATAAAKDKPAKAATGDKAATSAPAGRKGPFTRILDAIFGKR